MPSWGNVGVEAPPADVLAAECAGVSAVVLGFTTEEFALPTRCHPWDVKALVGHRWRDMDRLRTGLAEPAPSTPDTDGVSYWRSYDPVAKGPEIADRSREVADRFQTGAELALDLTMEPWPTDAGSAITCGILLGLLDADLPEAVGWSQLTFIEAGTGRRALTDPETASFGELTGRFPLMG